LLRIDEKRAGKVLQETLNKIERAYIYTFLPYVLINRQQVKDDLKDVKKGLEELV